MLVTSTNVGKTHREASVHFREGSTPRREHDDACRTSVTRLVDVVFSGSQGVSLRVFGTSFSPSFL